MYVPENKKEKEFKIRLKKRLPSKLSNRKILRKTKIKINNSRRIYKNRILTFFVGTLIFLW